MKQEIVTPMITSEEIDKRITALAREIEATLPEGETLTVVCTLKGAVVFFVDLVKKFSIPVKMDFLEASSYGDKTVTSGTVKINKDLTNTINGEHVLLVEDIVDTGTTLKQLIQHLERQKPASLKVCTLLDKPSRRTVPNLQPDYIGFEIEDKFVIGYGLDYAQRYRNLPYIATMQLIDDKPCS